MAKIVGVEPSGRFSTMLVDAMEKKKVSIAELAERSDTSYEHIRRLVNGLAYPSRHLLEKVVRELGMTRVQAEQAIAKDKIEAKFGPQVMMDFSTDAMNRNPELAPIEKHWDYLTREQKRMVTTTVEALAKENRRKG